MLPGLPDLAADHKRTPTWRLLVFLVSKHNPIQSSLITTVMRNRSPKNAGSIFFFVRSREKLAHVWSRDYGVGCGFVCVCRSLQKFLVVILIEPSIKIYVMTSFA